MTALPEPQPKRANWWRPLLGLAVAAVLIVLLVTRVDLHASWQEIRRLEQRLLWLPGLLLMAGLSVRPWRWQVIFPPAARPTFWSCFSVWSIANMSNNFLPARGGDVLRCFLIARGARLKAASLALATLGVEKVLDGLALLAVVVLSFWFLTPPGWLQSLIVVAALIFCAALAAMIVLHYRPRGFQRFVSVVFYRLRRPRLGHRISGLLGSFAEGLGAVSSWRQMSALALLTGLTWFVEMAFVWAAAKALGISLSLPASMVVAAVIGLGLMIPAAPGYVGSYEFFSVAVLGMFGVAPESALALAVVMHAGVLIMTTVFGLSGLAATGISLSQVAAGRLERESEMKEALLHGK